MNKSFLDLRFSSDMEEKYQDASFENSIFIYRVLGVLGAAIYGLFFLSDYRDFPAFTEQAFMIRFMIVIPIILLISAASFASFARRWIKPLASLGLLAAEGGALALLGLIQTPQAQLVYFGSTFLMISITNSIIWQGYIWNAITSLLIIVCYGMVMGIYIEPFVPLTMHLELLSAMAAFGATANYFVELHLRNEFRMTFELRRQKIRAVNATRLKDKFVTLVSHDLRSPLSSVLGLVEFLKSADASDLSSQRKEEILSNIQATIEGLLNLIGQLLKLSALRTGKISVQKKIIGIRSLADQHISNISHLAEKKDVRISNDIPEDMVVVADPALLGEVIHNLLANAVKFTQQGGAISVFRKGGERNEIGVRDTGEGISPESLPGLFEHKANPYAPGATERISGLGLPFSHDIISAHGGELEVESTQGEGSLFSVILPGFRRLVMLADSDEAIRRSMREMIRELEGVEVIEAEDGQTALRTLERIAPDLVIAGVNLQRLDGFSLLDWMKSHARLSQVPVIITAPMAYSPSQGPHPDNNLRRAALSMGASDFMAQPVISDNFLAIVQRYTG
ncbi:MAG: hybrid sensor histidine kinase/response regulator [Nitrospinota bacterium]|nr:hybrid sensor histidine kinase/response regulator [Nitrospinota bacterium]